MLKVFLSDPHCSDREYLGRAATYISYNSTLTGWTLKLLNECWLLEIGDGAYIYALVWCNRTAEPGALEFHAVAAPQYHGRWLTRGVINQINTAIEHIGADRLVAQVTSPLAARIWSRLGFTVTDDIAVKESHGLAL